MLYSWNIIGHEHQLELLEKDIKQNNLSHCYLFSGPDHIGKLKTAKTFAQILQCKNNFCHECKICTEIKKGNHLDTMIYEDDSESIKIEQTRAIISNTNLTGQNKYKIIIMQNIERMTEQAANCFLKTLEEPPEKVIFILTTSNMRALLPTIISRIRLVEFQHIAEEKLQNKLKEKFPDIDQEIINKALAFGIGKPGKAINLLEDRALLDLHQKFYNTLEDFLKTGSLEKKFAFVEELSKNTREIPVFLDIFVHLLRSHLYHSIKNKNFKKYGKPEIISLINRVAEAKILISKNVNTRLVLENLMLNI